MTLQKLKSGCKSGAVYGKGINLHSGTLIGNSLTAKNVIQSLVPRLAYLYCFELITSNKISVDYFKHITGLQMFSLRDL